MFAKHSSSFINTSRNLMSYGKSFIQLASISFVREHVNVDSSLKIMDLQGNISPQSYSSVIERLKLGLGLSPNLQLNMLY